MPEQAHLTVLCRVAEVTDAAPVRVVAQGCAFAVFAVGGRFYVTQDSCTHGPGSLSEGFVDGEEIECPFHQGRFHIPTGRPTGPPCTVPLRIWPVQVVDGYVCIDVNAGRIEAD